MVPTFPWGDIGVHFTTFTILALLAHGVRWPKGIGWPALALLLAYGITTESLQWFVPQRSVALLDYMENLLGVAVGTGIYGLAHRLIQQGRAAPMPAADLEPPATHDNPRTRVAFQPETNQSRTKPPAPV